jgi:hypothetical protein
MNKRATCGFIALFLLTLGGLLGYAAVFLPKMVAGIFGVVFAAVFVFIGIVLSEIHYRGIRDEELQDQKRELETLVVGLRGSAMKLLSQQRRAYGEVSKAQSNIVSTRIGVRLVEEMLHGMENDEQKDAAYRQVGVIIEEELAKVNQEVWGDRLCPKDDSVG